MRAQFGSVYISLWAYNLIGSSRSDTFCVPNEIGTQVYCFAGTSYATYRPTLATRTSDMVVRATTFISSTMWSELLVQSQHRANVQTYQKEGAKIYPTTFRYDGSRYALVIIGSIAAPDLDQTFRGRYIWGLSGSNFYTRFAGFSHCILEDPRWTPFSPLSALYGTLESKTIPVNGTLATLIFRGTNNSEYSISPRHITLFGSYTGTAGTNGTVVVVDQAMCSRQGGHVTLTSGNWGDIGIGTVWIGTFFVSPLFGTFRYVKEKEVQIYIEE